MFRFYILRVFEWQIQYDAVAHTEINCLRIDGSSSEDAHRAKEKQK